MDAKLFNKPHKDARRMVPESHQYITIDRIKELLPKNTSVTVTEEIVQLIHNMEEDTGLPQELLEEDLMSYMHLLGGTRGLGVKDLINAIKFCNLKRNYNNKEAWAIVFPDKYKRLVENNKQVDNHVSMYNSSKLVVAIDKEMLLPASITHSPYFRKAVNELYKIGVLGDGGKNAKGEQMTVSPMVKVQALKELINVTKPPEEQQLNISINPGETALNMQKEMNEQLKAIVANQRVRLEAGEDIIDVQAIGIDFTDVGVEHE